MKNCFFFILILISYAQCKAQDVKERMYFVDEGRVEAFDLDREIVKLFRKFVLKVNKQDENEIYAPKRGEIKKRSTIEGSKKDGKWVFSITKIEHDLQDVEQLIELLNMHFYSSTTIALNNIDSVYLPVEYFDSSQLEKL
ncbi:MAG: hypothetical protein R2828_21525 [Saprospiraceae bacterium]